MKVMTQITYKIIPVMVVTLMSCASFATDTAKNATSSDSASVSVTATSDREAIMSASDFKIKMRKLWSDHVVWTRMYIVSALAKLDGTDETAKRLLDNQTEIGDSIKSFYGVEAGNKLGGLLKEHILLAVKLVEYAQAGNQALLAVEEKKWYGNADSIASLLSNANSNIPRKHIADMLYKHLALTKQEVVFRIKKDYTSDIATYDKIYDEMMTMSDFLSEAIIKQFSNQFSNK